mgnify:FL=1
MLRAMADRSSYAKAMEDREVGGRQKTAGFVANHFAVPRSRGDRRLNSTEQKAGSSSTEFRVCDRTYDIEQVPKFIESPTIKDQMAVISFSF